MAETLENVADLVCKSLPSGWSIHFEFYEGEMTVELTNPEGDRVDHWDGGDGFKTLWLYVVAMVNYARTEDGLEPVPSPEGAAT